MSLSGLSRVFQVRQALTAAQRISMSGGMLKYWHILRLLDAGEIGVPRDITRERFAAMVVQSVKE